MEESPNKMNEGLWTAPAAELLRAHCEQVVAYAAPEPDEDRPSEVAKEITTAPTPERDDLRAPIAALVERYEDSHQGTTLVPLRYVSVGHDEPSAVGVGDLPADVDVVSLSVTETVVDADEVRVASRVLLAERRTERTEAGHG